MSTLTKPDAIALLSGFLPMVTVIACYLVSIYTVDNIPACMPLLEGCTSISSTGRHGAAYYLFKALMLPAATLILLFWLLLGHWLLLVNAQVRSARTAVLLGTAAAAFLALYTTFLGSIGDEFQLLRRIGVTAFFGLSCVAQLCVWAALRDCPELTLSAPKAWLALRCLILSEWLLGLTSLPLFNLTENTRYWENVLEWNFALIMMLFFPVTALLWRATGFVATLSTSNPTPDQTNRLPTAVNRQRVP